MEPDRVFNYRNRKDTPKESVESTKGGGHVYQYKPSNKKEREARQRVWDRYTKMKDDPLRKEAEKEWDLGMKMYRMWAPERDEDDWRADLILPDGFAAIQTHMQETVDLKPRPQPEAVESSDEAIEQFANAIMNHNMDRTDFDLETHWGRNYSAITGTAFYVERYILDKRTVQDLDDVDSKTGELKYKEREIVEKDDTFTEHIENEFIYVDETAKHITKARDFIERELIDWDDFQLLYKDHPHYENVDRVVPAVVVSKNAKFFKHAEDMHDNAVELLHYYNKLRDEYIILANNVIIRQSPIPFKHKELPLAVQVYYPVPGRIYGMGIPHIISSLAEERKAGRDMTADRRKMHLAKFFIVNDLFDIDEKDLTPRPHGLVKVNTGGLPLNQVILPLEYGDISGSSVRLDDSLLEDERRAHGIDDRVQGVNQGGTATEAAILKEAAQKRINLVNALANMDFLKRIGRLKWSNIQFFYPIPRVDRITLRNEEREKKTYRKIKVDGKEFTIAGDTKKGETPKLLTKDIEGSTVFTLDKTHARFIEGDWDIKMGAGATLIISRAIRQAKIVELTDRIMNNPLLAAHADGKKVFKRLISVHDEDVRDWGRDGGLSTQEQIALAEQENRLLVRMAERGETFELPPTPDASQEHTLQHITFTETSAFEALPQAHQEIMENHILAENERNPETGDLASLMKEGEGEDAATATGQGGENVPPGMPGGPLSEATVPNAAPVTGGDVTEGNPEMLA